ncbi:MAG: NnrS family protein, partial [Giesbergeria sp.]|nr:NnrS family protein [Giesbergeria sp.]
MKSSAPPLSSAPAAAAALKDWPVLRLGFRPFYIGTALVAAISVPLWIASFLGWIALDLPLAPLLWHAHEMLFGFAAGVIAGFLLTAVKAWTGLATPRGTALGALFVLWVAARIAALTGPYGVYAALDVALLPAVAVILLRVLLQAKNRRNLPLIGVLLLLGAANAAFHLSVLDVLDIAPLQP